METIDWVELIDHRAVEEHMRRGVGGNPPPQWRGVFIEWMKMELATHIVGKRGLRANGIEVRYDPCLALGRLLIPPDDLERADVLNHYI